MCLGAPGQVIRVHEGSATVDFWGTPKIVKLEILTEPVAAGDYIVEHAGYAIRRIAPADVADTLMMYEAVLAECDSVEKLEFA